MTISFSEAESDVYELISIFDLLHPEATELAGRIALNLEGLGLKGDAAAVVFVVSVLAALADPASAPGMSAEWRAALPTIVDLGAVISENIAAV